MSRSPGPTRDRWIGRMGRMGLTLVAGLASLALHGCDRGDAPDSGLPGPGTSRQAGARSATGHPDGWETTLTDGAGRTVHLVRPARRIISLVPSATATLRALGAADRLVGRTDYDTDPALAHLPSVGGGLEPNLEALAALRPDLVVRFAGPQDRQTPARLDDLGIAHLAVRPDGVDDVLETTRLLGDALGRPLAGDSLATRIRAELDSVAQRVRDLPTRRVVYLLGGSPPWVAGPDTYIQELLTRVGGRNVFEDLDALYAPVAPEELRARAVDVVLVSDSVAFDPTLTPGARVEIVDPDLEIPGPDLGRSAHELARLLHGPLPPAP